MAEPSVNALGFQHRRNQEFIKGYFNNINVISQYSIKRSFTEVVRLALWCSKPPSYQNPSLEQGVYTCS